MTWVRRAEYAILAVFAIMIAAVLGVLIVLSLIDWNGYRDDIEAGLAAIIAQPVNLEGELDFQVLPVPALTVGGITIGDVLEIEKLEVRLAILPIFAGRIEFATIYLNRPVLNIREEADGTFNWQLPETDSSEGPGAPDESALDVIVSNLSIRQGAIRFLSPTKGTDLSFTDISLDLTSSGRTGPFEVSGRLDFAGEEYEVEISTGTFAPDRPIRIEALFSLPSRSVSARLSGNLNEIQEAAKFDGNFSLEGTDLGSLLAMADISDSLIDQPLPFSLGAEVNASEQEISFAGYEVSVGANRARGSLTVGLGDILDVQGSLQATSLDFAPILAALAADEGPADSSPFAISLPAIPDGISGALTFSADAVAFENAVVQNVVFEAGLSPGQIVLGQASATLPGASEIGLAGRFTNEGSGARFAGDVTLRSADLLRLLNAVGVDTGDFSRTEPMPARLTAHVNAGEGAFGLVLTDASVDRTTVTGEMKLTTGATPTMALDLQLDRIDLDRYVTSGPENDAHESDLRSVKVPWPEGIIVEGKVRAGQLIYDGMDYNDVALIAVIGDQAVKIDELSVANIDGGSVTLEGTIEENSDGLAGELQLSFRGNRAGAFSQLFSPAADFLNASENIAVEASLQGRIEAFAIDADVVVGPFVGSLQGEIRNADLAPEYSASFAAESPSLAAALDYVGMETADLGIRDGVELSISGDVAGTLSDTALNVTVEAGAAATAALRIVAPDDTLRLTGTLRLAAGDTGASMRHLIAGSTLFGPNAGATSLQIDVELSDNRVVFSGLEGELAGVAVAGDASFAFGDGATNFDVALQTGAFGAGVLSSDQEEFAPTASEPFRWSSEATDVSWLREYSGRLSLQSEQILYQGYDAKELELAIVLGSGTLRTERLSGELFGGSFQGQFTMDGNGTPRIALNIEVDQTDLNRALMALADLDVLTGRGSATVSLEMRGRSEQAMVSSLAGNIHVVAGGGQIKGIDVPALSARLERFGSTGGTNGPRGLGSVILSIAFDTVAMIGSTLAGGDTAYLPFSVPITVRRGVLSIPTTDVTVEGGLLNTVGTMDLPAWHTEISADLALNSFPDAPSAGIDVVGPIDAPETTYRTSELATYMIGRATREVEGPGEAEVPDQPQTNDTPAGLGSILLDEFFNRLREGQAGGTP